MKSLKFILVLFIFTMLSSCAHTIDKEIESSKILFVLTNHDKLGNSDKKTGAYLSEITHPYEILKKAGFEIEFASPKGGEVPIDGLDNMDEVTFKLYADISFKKKLNNTTKMSRVVAKNYKAIYFAGGHGTMFDLPENKHIQMITKQIYESGGVVSAVCHGPAALVNVVLSNGKYLVSGKRMASFTDAEEKAVKKVKLMPFLLEEKLKERGALHIKEDNFKPLVIVDKRLVTGQNPASAKLVGKKILELIK